MPVKATTIEKMGSWFRITEDVSDVNTALACPYGARSFIAKNKKKGVHRQDLPPIGVFGAPGHSFSNHGVVEKCTFCFIESIRIKRR